MQTPVPRGEVEEVQDSNIGDIAMSKSKEKQWNQGRSLWAEVNTVSGAKVNRFNGEGRASTHNAEAPGNGANGGD